MSDTKKLIESDVKRRFDKKPLIKSPELKWQIAYRKACGYKKNSILGIWYRLTLRRLSLKTGIQIPTDTQIGKGLFIAHFGTIIINPNVVIGDNVNIAPGVVIGKANRGERMGVPTIGNNVWIGANSVITGGISIGDDVLIAPAAFVNTDVPSHSIVVGNPAVIHSRNNATEGYINRRV